MITGNTLSALVGITTFHFIDQSLLAIPLAASLSILGMYILRCLYPPAAAVALITVLGHIGSYRHAFSPSAGGLHITDFSWSHLQQPHTQALPQ